MSAATKKILGPFNRVEGDLEVHVEVQDGVIIKAWVNSPLFRGFEQILHGKEARDALVYTPRICGICSVSQSVAAAMALAAMQGITPYKNGQLATNLILAAENMADHLTHFYLFFMPDFARDEYEGRRWFESIVRRFKAQLGTASRDVLPSRADFLHLTGILAGKWPHSLALQPGGTTRPVEAQEKIRLTTTIHSFRRFLETTLFGDSLENVCALSSSNALADWANAHAESDFGRFLMVADDLNLTKLGRAADNFMSYGAYANANADEHLFQSGVWQEGYATFNSDDITEDISHSWLSCQTEPKHPYHGSTITDTEQSSDGYSWCKAPRLNRHVMEVGALARQVINKHPLILDLVRESGGNVRNRVVARLLELALVVPEMERWTKRLQPKEPFCHSANLPAEAQGAGLVEAARGSLGHWIRVRSGRILNYQIIAPTTWNFSPRDSENKPGALELALQDTEVGADENASAVIQHIIRSFDPCMVCTVH